MNIESYINHFKPLIDEEADRGNHQAKMLLDALATVPRKAEEVEEIERAITHFQNRKWKRHAPEMYNKARMAIKTFSALRPDNTDAVAVRLVMVTGHGTGIPVSKWIDAVRMPRSGNPKEAKDFDPNEPYYGMKVEVETIMFGKDFEVDENNKYSHNHEWAIQVASSNNWENHPCKGCSTTHAGCKGPVRCKEHNK